MLIFAEKKADVDAIHEYLLLKGVEAVAIHGGKGTGFYAEGYSVLHQKPFTSDNLSCKQSFGLLVT